MNFLYAYPNPEKTLKELGSRRVNGKVVYYDFYCGLDFTLFTQELCDTLYQNRFGRFNNKRRFIKGLRIAWDRTVKEQIVMKKAIDMLKKAGYDAKTIQVFMLTNGLIPFSECKLKLDLMKVWNVQVADCWFDNQKRGSVIPIYWNEKECKIFGRECRKHNQIITFGIDPELDHPNH